MKEMKAAVLEQLKSQSEYFKQHSLSQLFAKDAARFENFSCSFQNLLIDYSKNYLTAETLNLLMQLAHACNVPQALSKLNAGGIVNLSENRPALHSALRQPKALSRPEVQKTLERMEKWVTHIHQSDFTDIVNIGIGGSDLGPEMAALALSPYAVTSQRLHFVSTLDTQQIHETLAALHPEKTLFIVSSKSFSTQETLVNAQIAREWAGENFFQQSFAVTSQVSAAQQWGMPDERILPLWEWVGGRYSIWSAIGFPIALKMGMKNFYDFLSGGHAVDKEMLSLPLEKNPAVILALLNIWMIDFFDAQTHAILPYDVRLSRFPAYLQQLEMESNGKSVTQQNTPVNLQTGPIIWGEPGTNGQHAFYQLLHQGTQTVPADFIIAKKPSHSFQDEHLMLVSHCLSQARALMVGEDSSLSYKILKGNHPSTMIILPELNPYYLGVLIALYEYKVFISSVIWDTNPFDQWGVELGKKMAAEVYQYLKTPALLVDSPLDASTKALVTLFSAKSPS
jgi:glucose-6-phosphate isomerase